MVELEESLLLILSSYMTSWKRSVDKAIVYVKTDAMKYAGAFYSLTSKKLMHKFYPLTS